MENDFHSSVLQEQKSGNTRSDINYEEIDSPPDWEDADNLENVLITQRQPSIPKGIMRSAIYEEIDSPPDWKDGDDLDNCLTTHTQPSVSEGDIS